MQQSDTRRVEQTILAFVRDNFPGARQLDLQLETELFREGIVDSIGILSLVKFLEDSFDVEIDPVEMLLENFSSAAAMRDFVLAKKGGRG